MVLSIEEALKQGVKIVGMGTKPDFAFTAKICAVPHNNIVISNILDELFNTNFKISLYSKEKIQHLTFIFVVYPSNHKGVDWKERKSYSRTDKILRLEIKFPEYERFCKAEKPEVLKIMAEQTLRGCEVFLTKEKDFDYPKFRADLISLFRAQGWIE